MENRFVWHPLDLNNLKEHHPTRECRFCGEPLMLLALNDNIVFYVHRGEALKKCQKIAFNTSYLKGLASFISSKTKMLEAQKVHEKPGGEAQK